MPGRLIAAAHVNLSRTLRKGQSPSFPLPFGFAPSLTDEKVGLEQVPVVPKRPAVLHKLPLWKARFVYQAREPTLLTEKFLERTSRSLLQSLPLLATGIPST